MSIKIDWREAAIIRQLCEKGLPNRVIAHRYGVGVDTIRRIKNGETWKAEADPKREEHLLIAAAEARKRLLDTMEEEFEGQWVETGKVDEQGLPITRFVCDTEPPPEVKAELAKEQLAQRAKDVPELVEKAKAYGAKIG